MPKSGTEEAQAQANLKEFLEAAIKKSDEEYQVKEVKIKAKKGATETIVASYYTIPDIPGDDLFGFLNGRGIKVQKRAENLVSAGAGIVQYSHVLYIKADQDFKLNTEELLKEYAEYKVKKQEQKLEWLRDRLKPKTPVVAAKVSNPEPPPSPPATVQPTDAQTSIEQLEQKNKSIQTESDGLSAQLKQEQGKKPAGNQTEIDSLNQRIKELEKLAQNIADLLARLKDLKVGTPLDQGLRNQIKIVININLTNSDKVARVNRALQAAIDALKAQREVDKTPAKGHQAQVSTTPQPVPASKVISQQPTPQIRTAPIADLSAEGGLLPPLAQIGNIPYRIRTVESVGAVFNLILPKHQPPFTEKENEGQRRDRIQKQIEHVLGEVEGKASDFERQFSGNRWQFQVYQRAQEALNSPLSVIEGLDFSNQANVDAARKKIKAALEERITSSAGGDYREKLSAGIGEKNQQAFDTMLEAKAQWHLMLSAANAPQEKGRLAVVTERLDTTATLMSKIVATKGFLEDDPSFKEDLYKLQTGTPEFETFLKQRTIEVQKDLGLHSKIDKDGEKLFVITKISDETINRIIEEKSHKKKIIWTNIPAGDQKLVEKLCLQQWKKVTFDGQETALSQLMPDKRGNWTGWVRGIRGSQDGAVLMQQLLTEVVGNDANRLREFCTDLALHAEPETIKAVLDELTPEQQQSMRAFYSKRMQNAAKDTSSQLARAELYNALKDLVSITGVGDPKRLYQQTAEVACKELTPDQKIVLVQHSYAVVEESVRVVAAERAKQIDARVGIDRIDEGMKRLTYYLDSQKKLAEKPEDKKLQSDAQKLASQIEANIKQLTPEQQRIVRAAMDNIQKHVMLVSIAQVGPQLAFKLPAQPASPRKIQPQAPQPKAEPTTAEPKLEQQQQPRPQRAASKTVDIERKLKEAEPKERARGKGLSANAAEVADEGIKKQIQEVMDSIDKLSANTSLSTTGARKLLLVRQQKDGSEKAKALEEIREKLKTGEYAAKISPKLWPSG